MIFGIRIITADIDRLVAFYERLSGSQAVRPTPFFAELRLDTAMLSFVSAETVAMLGRHAPHPGDNHTVLVEFLVEDTDAEFERLREQLSDVVQEPATMAWGNRSAVFLDPDGNVVNLFSRPAAG